MKLIPKEEALFNWTPVDYVAKTIVYIANHVIEKELLSETQENLNYSPSFHIINSNGLTKLSDIMKALLLYILSRYSRGYHVEFMDIHHSNQIKNIKSKNSSVLLLQ